MKREAIKRGQRVDTDWEVDEDEERVAMTNADAITLQEEGDQNSVTPDDEVE